MYCKYYLWTLSYRLDHERKYAADVHVNICTTEPYCAMPLTCDMQHCDEYLTVLPKLEEKKWSQYILIFMNNVAQIFIQLNI